MLVFTVNDKYYAAYAAKEYGNPHPKKYACIFDFENKEIPDRKQKKIIRDFLVENSLDYHEYLKYKECDINTSDMVNTLLKFYKNKRLG